MVEKWDPVPVLVPLVPQDPMDHRDSQNLWILRPPGTLGPQEPWEITSAV